MVTTLPMPAFIHSPLDLTKPTIRVLRLENVRRKTGISCSLEHINLEENAFVCLSYAWGDINGRKHTISVNGSDFQVGQSLFDFLRQAQAIKINEWLWIDAICIDQQNARERGHQVKLMGQIYKLAKHVLVYPGKTRIKRKVLDSLCSTSHSPASVRHVFQCYRQFVLAKLAPFDQFTTLQYWSRMWIVQELFLAKELYIVFGNITRPFDDLKVLWRASRGSFSLPEAILLLDWKRKGFDDSDESIPDIFSYTTASQCTEPNDRLYALLGLLPMRYKEVVVDYGRPWGTIVLDVLEIEARTNTDLQVHIKLLRNLRCISHILCLRCAESTLHMLMASSNSVSQGHQGRFCLTTRKSATLTCTPCSTVTRWGTAIHYDGNYDEMKRHDYHERQLELLCHCCLAVVHRESEDGPKIERIHGDIVLYQPGAVAYAKGPDHAEGPDAIHSRCRCTP